jgi:hypothetical protein
LSTSSSQAAGLIVGRVAYFDTVQILTKTKLGQQKVLQLEQVCGSVIAKPTKATGYACLYKLHQPEPAAFALLQQWLPDPKRYCVNSVHRALDLIAADQQALDQLEQFFQKHLVLRWHGKSYA